MTKPFLLNQIIYVFWFGIQTFSWKWHSPHFSVLFPSSFQQSSAPTHYKYLTVHKLVVNLACSVFFYPMLFHQEPQSWNPSQQPCHPHLEHGQKSWISINLDLTSLIASGTLLLCLTSCRLCCLSSSQPFTFAFFTQSSGSSYFLLSLWFVFHATTLLKQPHILLQTFCSEVFTSFLTSP